MRIKDGFNLRSICGEYILIAEGKENIDFTSVISMNESSAYLWNHLQGREFTHEDMVKLLTDEYEVDDATALKDCQSLTHDWIEAGICEP
ncbi:MAG: PqqD family protein [Prevotella sp.]|jgi:hypothetical protein